MNSDVLTHRKIALSTSSVRFICSICAIIAGILIGITLFNSELSVTFFNLKSPFQTVMWKFFLAILPNILVILSSFSLFGWLTRGAVLTFRSIMAGFCVVSLMSMGSGIVHSLICIFYVVSESGILLNLLASLFIAASYNEKLKRKSISNDKTVKLFSDNLFLLGVRCILFFSQGALMLFL